jgi:hypothetical protein
VVTSGTSPFIRAPNDKSVNAGVASPAELLALCSDPHNDQSLPTDDFIDQPRGDQSLISRLEEVQRARSARRQSPEGVRFKDGEQPLSERDLLRRSLEPEIIRDTWPSRQRQWRPATLVAFAVIMASIGAAILFRRRWASLPVEQNARVQQ